MDCEEGTVPPVNIAVEHTRIHMVHVSRLQERMVRGEVEAHGVEHNQHGGVLVADCMGSTSH